MYFDEATAKVPGDNLWNKLSEDSKALMPLDTYQFSKHYGQGRALIIIAKSEEFLVSMRLFEVT